MIPDGGGNPNVEDVTHPEWRYYYYHSSTDESTFDMPPIPDEYVVHDRAMEVSIPVTLSWRFHNGNSCHDLTHSLSVSGKL